jgi:predicted nuclease with TOPRIM domain
MDTKEKLEILSKKKKPSSKKKKRKVSKTKMFKNMAAKLEREEAKLNKQLAKIKEKKRDLAQRVSAHIENKGRLKPKNLIRNPGTGNYSLRR